MVVRRDGARRRRLVVDPAVQMGEADARVSLIPSAPPKRTKNNNSDVRTYTYGADRRNQPKTTDLIPKRTVSYLSVVLVLLVCLSLINLAARHSSEWGDRIGEAGLMLFAIGGPGSLASWFSSFLLIITGLASLQIYAMRRHRCDDYRGTYRLWLWMAAFFIVASITCVADLGSVTSHLFNSFTGQSFADRAWIPVAAKLAALTVLVGGGLYEVRKSRGSLALVCFVWAVYAGSIILPLLDSSLMILGVSLDVVAANCVLFGTAALLLAHLTYGRFIFLDANGMISRCVKKKKAVQKKKNAKPTATKKKKTKTVSGAKTPVRESSSTKSPVRKKRTRLSKPKVSVPPAGGKSSDNASKTPSEVLRELAAASRAKEQSQHTSDYRDDFDEAGPKSKAQRRKQRKLEKQRRRAA